MYSQRSRYAEALAAQGTRALPTVVLQLPMSAQIVLHLELPAAQLAHVARSVQERVRIQVALTDEALAALHAAEIALHSGMCCAVMRTQCTAMRVRFAAIVAHATRLVMRAANVLQQLLA